MPCKPLSCMCGKYAAPQRHVVAVMSLFAIITAYCQRVCLNIAIVEMVKPLNKTSNATKIACPSKKTTTISKIAGGTHDWDEFQQNIILLTFYIGYLPGHAAGPLCDRYGSKWFLTGGIIISTLSNIAMPFVVWYMHWSCVAILRIIQGIGQGTVYPGVTSLMSRWVPPGERATLGGVAYSGNSIGTILGTFISGMIISGMKSWTMVFYFWALVGSLWVIFFVIFVHSDPTTHPHITPEEKEYLLEQIVRKEKTKAPFCAIITDLAVWAIIIGQVGHDWILYTLISNLPKYMNNVLNYNIKENAVASSVPYVAQYVSSLICGKVADVLINKKHYNREIIRKVYCAIGSLIPGAFVLLAGYMNCHGVLAIIFFSIGLFFKGPSYSSVKVNPIDITSHHAGLIMSIANGIGSLTGIATPYVISALAPNNSLEQWHVVFWVVFGTQVATTLFYIFFAISARAVWDYSEEEKKELPEDQLRPKRWYSKKPKAAIEPKDDAAKKDKPVEEPKK